MRIVSPFRRRLLLRVLACVGRWCLRRAHPAAPRRILLIKPDHLGDMLLCTPALHLLRQRFPQAHIVMLAGPWSAFLLQDNRDIDALLTLPFPGFARGAAAAGLLHPYALLLRSALLLRAGRFDAALLLRDDHWWGAVLALLAGIPRRIGYAVPECRPFLSHALPWHPAEHVTRQALALVAALANDAEAAPWRPEAHPLRYAPPPDAVQWAASWLAGQGVTAGERLVIVHAGTGGASKLWLPERWAAVADDLANLPGVRLLLTGGPGEEAQVAALTQRLRKPPLVLAGTASVGQLVALLGRAALVLGVDSGPLHLAVSQGTPSLHLFGPSDAGRFGPWGAASRHVVLRAGLWCSPCGVFAACPRQTDPPECMQHISVAQVLTQARRLLALAE
jgi:heptosyltransferase-2/heptosyltransferase-3